MTFTFERVEVLSDPNHCHDPLRPEWSMQVKLHDRSRHHFSNKLTPICTEYLPVLKLHDIYHRTKSQKQTNIASNFIFTYHSYFIYHTLFGTSWFTEKTCHFSDLIGASSLVHCVTGKHFSHDQFCGRLRRLSMAMLHHVSKGWSFWFESIPCRIFQHGNRGFPSWIMHLDPYSIAWNGIFWLLCSFSTG